MLSCILLLLPAAVGPPSTNPVPFDFATKNPYWMTSDTPPREDPGQGCEAVRIEFVGRHGSRYGSNSRLNALQETLQGPKGAAIGNPDLAFLRNWTNPFPSTTQKQLNEHGMEEWYGIGQRFAAEFDQTVLKDGFNPDVTPIRTTFKSRTSRSASSFALSAFQGAGGGGGGITPCSLDPPAMYSVFSGSSHADGDIQLRFFANCPAYEARVLSNASHPGNAEPAAYLKGNITDEMLPRVRSKLALNPLLWNLTTQDLQNFYEACSYEVVALRKPVDETPCAVFSPEDYPMWAFYADLGKYYKSGPGDILSQEIACPLAQDMLQGLASRVPGASFRFAHAETVLPLLAFFGLYSDGPQLTAGMPRSEAEQRVFRTGVIGTMAVNLQLVLYKCQSAKGTDTWKVEIKHSERQLRWPACGGAAFCSPEQLLSAYPEAQRCPFESLCSI